MIDKQHRLSVREQCHLLVLNRSSLYKACNPRESDTEIANRIAERYEKTPQYGYRRIHEQLKREGHIVNHKKVYRLMKEMGLKALYPKPKTTIRGLENKAYPYLLGDLKITRPHQVWQVDITYLRLPGGFVYLTAIIDVYSRTLLSWRLSNTLSTEFVIEVCRDALWRYGVPEIINTDQGVQFTSAEWRALCDGYGIQMSMSHKGGSTDNAHIERFWRTLKYEGFYLTFPQTMKELKHMLKEFIHWYNYERLHSALGYKPPMEVLKMARPQTCGHVENSSSFPHPHKAQQQPHLLIAL
jgi:putative transposase